MIEHVTSPPRYEAWLDYIFGRMGDGIDPFDMDWIFPCEPAELAELVTHTLTRSGHDLTGFTDRQVSHGLQAILFTNFSSIAHTLTGPHVDEAGKIAVLRAIGPLYADCLAPRAPPVLGHLSETRRNPLEYVTYMLWDVTPLDWMARKAKPQLDALLEVLAGALRLANPACVESALHGLGHLGREARARSQAVIDDWLSEQPQVRKELIVYAERARRGAIQ